MIARLEGVVVSASDELAVVMVGGIGLAVQMPRRSVDGLRAGAAVRLFTHLHVREDALQLYGFLEAADRDLFVTLLSVNHVGPSLALSVLSAMPADAFCAAVVEGNEKALRAIPGVGPKVAKRLVFELAERVKKLESIGQLPALAGGGKLAADAISGLIALGCKPAVAEAAVRRAMEELPGLTDVGRLIREALRRRGSEPHS